MADPKSTRLTGLWKRELPSGTTLFSGKVSVADLREAVQRAGTEELEVTVWLNDEKKSERSPDASLVVAPPYQKPEETSGVKEETPAGLVDDDIPF
jgi:hypothetical protein